MENHVIITNIESFLTTDIEVVEIFFVINHYDGPLKMYVINIENIL